MLLRSNEGHCFAVEHPDEKQYSSDPVSSDYKNYAGLKVVDVSNRLSYIIYSGLAIEALTLLFVILGLAKGRYRISNILGHFSLIWFSAIIFVRYDHFGRVCSGEYLGENETVFPDMMRAAEFGEIYVKAVWLVVFVLFFVVMIYSCCIGTPRKT